MKKNNQLNRKVIKNIKAAKGNQTVNTGIKVIVQKEPNVCGSMRRKTVKNIYKKENVTTYIVT